MKKIYNSVCLSLALILSYNLSAQCTLACYADINLALNVTGNASITASDVLDSFGPACGTLIVEPSSFDCTDIGEPVFYTVTDQLTGNSCFGFIHVEYNVGAMSCFANVNVALGPSGSETLTADMLLFDPPAECIPGLVISPSVVTCADVGSPVFVTITDPVSGNSYWSTVNVSYNVGAMSCFADINVQLDATGNYTLSPNDLLADPDADCILGAIISPSSFDCSDKGKTRFTTITDPVSGNSCWTNVTIDNPRPDSVNYTIPSPIYCGETGAIFTANIFGGYGPFEYEWEIKGNANGWSILSGQGTDAISMQVGTNRIRLKLTVTDICGRKRRYKIKVFCEEPPSIKEDGIELAVSPRTQSEDYNLDIYPNPTSHQLFVKISNNKDGNLPLRIINELGEFQKISINPSENFDELRINIEHLQTGIYWLIVEDHEQKTTAKKFVKF